MRYKFLFLCSRVCLAGVVVALLTQSWGAQSAGTLPEPHLFYGINVFSDLAHEEQWQGWMPLGFNWVKIWEEKVGPVTERLPHNVLYQIDCYEFPDDLEAWGDHVEDIVTNGQGLIEAYEICNEPNTFWRPDPHPEEYFQVLQEAYTRIKAVDPEAVVVAAGLAPVGRVQGNCNGYDGNNCIAMDELKFWRAFFDLGGGDYFDVFSIHPYGFAYEPETDPYSVSNNFCFRGAELQYAILKEYGLGDRPVWATEFGWMRAAAEDGEYPGWCWYEGDYRDYVGWIEVTASEQADYIVRAFDYADKNWPWMHGMFLWNLDWYDAGWLCEPARYYSIMCVDYDAMVDPSNEDEQSNYPWFAQAYDAVRDMDKRHAEMHPRLSVSPDEFAMAAAVSETLAFNFTAQVYNPWYYTLHWTATVDMGQQIIPVLAAVSGPQGSPLVFSVSNVGYGIGTYTGKITLTATPTDTVDAPRDLPVTLFVWPEIHRVYLPAVLQRHRPVQ